MFEAYERLAERALRDEPPSESEALAILDVFGIPYTFSDPVVMGITLNKGLTKSVIRDAGIPTPSFAVVGREADAAAIAFAPPYFVKPVAEGTSKGITAQSIVRERGALAPLCARLISEFRQPVLVETFLPGREFTIGVLGSGDTSEVVGTLEMGLRPGAESDVYSYANKEKCEELVQYILVRPEGDAAVAEAERFALAVWRSLGCRDAGRVDFRCDAEGRMPLYTLDAPFETKGAQWQSIGKEIGVAGGAFGDNTAWDEGLTGLVMASPRKKKGSKGVFDWESNGLNVWFANLYNGTWTVQDCLDEAQKNYDDSYEAA